MLSIILSLFGIFVLLVAVEALWIKKLLHVETARKIIHILSGVFIAFWPFWMSWGAIILISFLFLLVILLSQAFKIFNSIHGVTRLTRGELLYPVGIGLCAFIAPSPAFFMIAILNLALADGLAAVAGHRFGLFNGYKILGHKKSVIGTMTFFIVSAIIFTLGAKILSGGQPGHILALAIWFPLVLTGIENISWYGTDNITVPISVIILLNSL